MLTLHAIRLGVGSGGLRPERAPVGRKEVTAEGLVFEEGSDNVFAEPGLPDAAERLTKADLAMRVATALRMQRLTQATAADRLGIDEREVSRLLGGKVSTLAATSYASRGRLQPQLTMRPKPHKLQDLALILPVDQH
jgi:predicted XRE-type DNA-binding protein